MYDYVCMYVCIYTVCVSVCAVCMAEKVRVATVPVKCMCTYHTCVHTHVPSRVYVLVPPGSTRLNNSLMICIPARYTCISTWYMYLVRVQLYWYLVL